MAPSTVMCSVNILFWFIHIDFQCNCAYFCGSMRRHHLRTFLKSTRMGAAHSLDKSRQDKHISFISMFWRFGGEGLVSARKRKTTVKEIITYKWNDQVQFKSYSILTKWPCSPGWEKKMLNAAMHHLFNRIFFLLPHFYHKPIMMCVMWLVQPNKYRLEL